MHISTRTWKTKKEKDSSLAKPIPPFQVVLGTPRGSFFSAALLEMSFRFDFVSCCRPLFPFSSRKHGLTWAHSNWAAPVFDGVWFTMLSYIWQARTERINNIPLYIAADCLNIFLFIYKFRQGGIEQFQSSQFTGGSLQTNSFCFCFCFWLRLLK